MAKDKPIKITAAQARDYRSEDIKGRLYEGQKERRVIIDEALAHVKTNPTVIDLACGTGRYFDCVHGAHSKIFGVDGSEEMLREASQATVEGWSKLVCGDILTVDFENQQADAVLCMGTLGVFVPMEVSWLKGLHRWLGPGGVFCFDVVAWQPQEERKRSWKQAFALGCRVFAPGWAKTAIDHRFEATHIHLTETQLRARLFSAGFEIQKLQAWESPTVKRIDLIGWAKK